MLLARIVRFAFNVCGTALLFFAIATTGLLLMMAAIAKHLH